MKILFVAMHSVHFEKWIKHIENHGHELYWFDVLSLGELNVSPNLNEIIYWQKRKLPYIKGEYMLSKKMPKFHRAIQGCLEVTIQEKFESILLDIKPDVVHSFEMQSCSYPLLKVMNRYPEVNWVYSCWGSDLYFYKNIKTHTKQIKNVLSRVDYLLTDCKRDYKISVECGFKGEFLGVVPGGGGVNFKKNETIKCPLSDRKVILVKGYENRFGRALNVVKAIEELIAEGILDNEIIIFGAHKVVLDYVQNNELPFKCYSRNQLINHEVLELMGRSLIYIGNSISDGIPNTLIEAICLGAFPIQSEVGGAISEILKHDINGKIIQDSSSIKEIKHHIVSILNNENLLKQAMNFNKFLAENNFDENIVNKKIQEAYSKLKF